MNVGWTKMCKWLTITMIVRACVWEMDHATVACNNWEKNSPSSGGHAQWMKMNEIQASNKSV